MQQVKDGDLLFAGWHENLIDTPIFNLSYEDFSFFGDDAYFD
jgi:hypothetical protein